MNPPSFLLQSSLVPTDIVVQLADIVEVDLPITTILTAPSNEVDRSGEPIDFDYIPF